MIFKKWHDNLSSDLHLNFSAKIHGKQSKHRLKEKNRSSDLIVRKKYQKYQSPMTITSRGFSYTKNMKQDNDYEDLKLTTLNTQRRILMKKKSSDRLIQTEVREKKNCSSKCNVVLFEGLNQGKQKLMHSTRSLKFSINQKRFLFKVYKIEDFVNFLQTKNQKRKQCGYATIPTNLSVNYCLTQPKLDGSFLNGMDITVVPLYYTPQIQIGFKSFDIIKCIGTGGFAKVYLCRFLQDLNFYAMKVVRKQEIIKKNKQHILMNQLEVMKKVREHAFTIDLKFAFETENYIVFIVDFCPGSEFFNVIKKFKRMSERQARFYAIEILLGLGHIHKHQILYRDIKPENILLDINGHIKITDFGLSKPVKEEEKCRAYSFCGSPQYMSPQIITKNGHSFSSDFYSFGALLYEMITGLPPFYSQDSNKIFDGTLNKEIKFPKNLKISQEAQNLITSLLNKDQSLRLGSYFGVKQILAHPWFGNINQQEYLNKLITPPISFNSIQKIDLSFKEYQSENASIQRYRLEPQAATSKLPNFKYDFREERGKKIVNVGSFSKQRLSSEGSENKQNNFFHPHRNKNLTMRKRSQQNILQNYGVQFFPKPKLISNICSGEKMKKMKRKYFV